MSETENLAIEWIDAQEKDMLTALQRMKEDAYGFDMDPELTPFGVRVRVTPWGWIVLVRTITNWRILDCRNDPFQNVPTEMSGWARGWCYAEPSSFISSLLGALKWSGSPDTEPSGWVKSLPDERRHGEQKPGIRQE
jgi:hypothetical protein